MGQNSWSAIPQSRRDALRLLVFERDGWVCRVRGPKCTGLAEELDHIVQRHLGGAVFDPDNCRASCTPCNRGRRPRPPSELTVQLGPSREW